MPMFDRKHFARLADCLAIALAVSLPWSTTATGILAGLWLLAFVPTLNLQLLRRVIFTYAGGLPVLLVALGAVGMFWAEVPWAERIGGIASYQVVVHTAALHPWLGIRRRRRHHGRDSA
jgi:O-antigen ligase